MDTLTIVLYSLGQWSEYAGHPDESLAFVYPVIILYIHGVDGNSTGKRLYLSMIRKYIGRSCSLCTDIILKLLTNLLAITMPY